MPEMILCTENNSGAGNQALQIDQSRKGQFTVNQIIPLIATRVGRGKTHRTMWQAVIDGRESRFVAGAVFLLRSVV